MKRVLVTGAAGFVGRQALPELERRGFEIHGVGRSGAPPPGSGIHWHQADLLHPDTPGRLMASVEPTHLLHFAWYTEHGRFYTSPENQRWLESGAALLDAFSAAGGRRAVVAGTCAEYDWGAGTCVEGKTPLEPGTPYGVAKRDLFYRFQAWSAARGVSAAWGRIFFTFGPWEHPDRLVAYVIRTLLAGNPARTSHGRQERDFLFVRDIAEGFAALLDSTVEGPVNVAAGRVTTLADLIVRVARRVGREDLLELGAIPARENDVPLIAADTTRLNREVGFTPRGNLDESIDETIAFWRDQQETKGNAPS